MNLFVLHKNPAIAATMHTDKHVVKMILETAQLLSTAHHVLDADEPNKLQGLYRKTHTNHPCAKWVRESIGNYIWAYELFMALSHEYEHRYGKQHLSWTKLGHVLINAPYNIPLGDITPFAQAMPDQFVGVDAIEAYRHYYSVGKRHLHTWTGRPVPIFIQEHRHEANNDRSSVGVGS